GLAGIGSAFLWTYAVCSPVAGVLADRLSRARLVVFSLFAWSIVTALTGLVHSTRAKAIGIHMAGLCVGMVAGGTVSGYLAHHYGWRVPLLALGAIGAAIAV